MWHCGSLTLVDRTIVVLQKDTRARTVLESRIVLIRYGRVHHHDIMLIMIMKISDELLHLFQWESIRIQCEDLDNFSFYLALGGTFVYLSQIHVVDVGPHRLQRNVSDRVVCNDCGDLINILHAIPTLMEPKAPIRHHRGLADDVAVLPSDVDRARASKDVEVDDSSDHVVFEILPGGIAVDVEVHPVAVQHENPMSLSIVLTVLEVDWVVPVEVGSWRDQVRISRPQRANVVSCWASERIGIFSKSIDIRIIRKRSAKSDILGLENEGRSRSVKDGLPTAPAHDGEREGILGQIERQE